MTPTVAATLALPKVQRLLWEAEPQIRARAGGVRWLLVQPSWRLVTSDAVLLFLIKLAIYAACGFAAPWLLPLLGAVGPLLDELGVNETIRENVRELLDLVHMAVTQPDPEIAPIVARVLSPNSL